MLDLGKRVILIVILFVFNLSCNVTRQENNFKEVSLTVIGEEEYNCIYQIANDSIKKRILNKIGYYQYLDDSKKYLLDSLMCFNNTKDRFISAILMQQILKEGVADDIDLFYGEKIENEWYFWTGSNLFVSREMIKNQDIHEPLSFGQLHKIALKEVYSGYLLPNGEINEAWFTSHFEGPGWYKWDETPEQIKKLTRKDFEQRHLEYTRRMWEGRDTTTVHLIP